MERTKSKHILSCNKQARKVLYVVRKRLGKLCSKLRLLIKGVPKPRVIIRGLQRFICSSRRHRRQKPITKTKSRPDDHDLINGCDHPVCTKPVRIATFNAALFAMAPAVVPNKQLQLQLKPKSILKSSPGSSVSPVTGKSNLMKVSINVPQNQIMSSSRDDWIKWEGWNNIPVRSPLCVAVGKSYADSYLTSSESSSDSIWEVLKEVDADILALQDVKADEERGMQPLRHLADALGMSFVFAESWAPEYGNAVLSKWPITRSKVQKILNHQDIRNVLKATVDVPWMGEVNVYCTQLDYLDEGWRMKQMKAIIEFSTEGPYILAGGLNSLDSSDYSSVRWAEIIKYFEEIGKPKPKEEVMKFLKGRGYTDAKDYAGDYEPLLIIPKGQNVQGTCKYGTRVDYILSSPNSAYKFLPGSYSVVSSKGTSDHHIVMVDVTKHDDPSLQRKISVGSLYSSLLKAN